MLRDLQTNRYTRNKPLDTRRLLGVAFGLSMVGAYFGLMLYILFTVHQTPVTYP
jgi:hypothetical protein